MNKILKIVLLFLLYVTTGFLNCFAQTNDIHKTVYRFTPEELREDFIHFREILENEHCCTYEYTSKAEMDSLFEANFALIEHDMTLDEFFMLVAPITAKIGCMHTATWMPGRFYIAKPKMMFPLTIKLIDQQVVVTGSYNDSIEIPVGSVLFEINGAPLDSIITDLRKITSADAMNPYFIDSQLTKRFSQFYASCYGLPDGYEVTYLSPGSVTAKTRELTPTDDESIRKVVFHHFSNPPLEFDILEEENTAILTVYTFAYYTEVDYFRSFMESCFSTIKTREIENLILDLRGNGGGDPFCSTILLSYLEKEPVPYFAERYEKYEAFVEAIPLAEDHFSGNLYILVDGSCGSTNGHFCALLKYHGLGTFVGTPSGATYKCNAGRNTELRLPNTQLIITIGRSTYAAAVRNMDKAAPIMPDILVHETLDDFLKGRDLFMEKALEDIRKR